MRCGFCGHDNPAGAKRCKQCGAELKLQQSKSGVSFTVNEAPGSEAPVKEPWKKEPTTAAERAAAYNSAAKPLMKLFVAFAVIPAFLFIAFIFFMVFVGFPKKDKNQSGVTRKEITIDAVSKQLQKYHGLGTKNYKIIEEKVKAKDPYDGMFGGDGVIESTWYYLEFAGQQYALGKYETIPGVNASVPEGEWHSNYYSKSFEMSLNTASLTLFQRTGVISDRQWTVLNVTVNGTLPLWVNWEESAAILAGRADRTRWQNRLVTLNSDIVLEIGVNEPIKLTEEDLSKFRENWFFLNRIIVDYEGIKTEYFLYE